MDVSKYCCAICPNTKISELNAKNNQIDAELLLVANGQYSYMFDAFIRDELSAFGNVNLLLKVQAYGAMLKNINNVLIAYWQSRLA